MAKPIITVSTTATAKLVKFDIPGGVTTPEEFAEAVAKTPSLAGDKPVLLNGRGPVWGYAMLAHKAHPSPAVATFDPRLGYIVVATHDARFKEGGVIADPEAVA